MTGKRKRNPAVQSFTLQDWSAFAEVYGIPFRVGEYGAGASKGEMRKLLRAVTFIAYDASAIIPESMLIEFHEVAALNARLQETEDTAARAQREAEEQSRRHETDVLPIF